MKRGITSAPYRLVLDDGGLNLSRRPIQINDCTVRSIAIVLGRDYDTIYDVLARAGRRPCDGFDSNTWLESCGGELLGSRVDILDPAGLTPNNFSRIHPVGRFVLETQRHAWAVVDGIHRDLCRIREQPLEGVWQFHLPVSQKRGVA